MPYVAPSNITLGNLSSSSKFNTETTGNIAWLGNDAPYVRVYRSSDLSIVDSTNTNVTFGQERFDNQAMHDTSTNSDRLTVPANMGGLYLIEAHVQWEASVNGFRRVDIWMNSTMIARVQGPPIAAATPTYQTLSTIYRASPGDYFFVNVYQNSGAALKISAGAGAPEFMATWLRN